MDTKAASPPGNETLGALFGGPANAPRNIQTILDALPCPVALTGSKGELLCANSLGAELFRDARAGNETGAAFPGSAPLLGPEGQAVGSVVVFEDNAGHGQIEEALKETETQYRELVKVAPVGIYEVDFRTKRFLSVNDAMCRTTGYSRDEILRMNPFDLLDAPSRAKFQRRLEQWLRGEEPDPNVEFTVLTKGGREILAELNVTFTRDERGGPRGATVIAYDVTERRRAEEALLRQAEELRKKDEESLELIDGFTEGSWIVDRKAGTIKCSEKWMKRLGLDRVPEKERLAYTRTLSHPDDTNNGNSIWACMEAGAARFDLEYRVKTVDSGYIWTQNKGKIVYDAQGKAVKVYAATIDITERKRAEEALRESEEKFRVTQELSPDGFAIVRPIRDSAGAVTDFLWIYENDAAARMNDTNPKDVCGKRVSEVMPHHDQSPFGKAYKEVAETGEIRVVELASYDQDTLRQLRWFRVVAVPTAGRDVAILVQDVTDRKKAEETLRKSEEKYRLLFENMTEMFQILEPVFNEEGKVIDFRYIEVNKATEVLTGKKREDMEGHTALELFGIVEDYWFEMLGRALHNRESVHMTQYSRAVDLYYEVIAWAAGGGRVAIVFSNITDRKRAEEALKEKTRDLEESNRQRADILESISDCFYALDKELRFTYVNKGAEEIWNLSRNDLLGRKIEDVFPGLIDISLSKFRQVLAEQEPQYYEIFSKVAQKWGDMSVYPTPDGLSVYFHDITERKLAEETKERLNALMDNNPSLVFLKDEEGRYVYLNKAYETHFIPTGGWVGKTDYDFWPKESAELFRANDAAVLNSGQTMQFMEDSTDHEGNRYCWLNYKFPFIDSKNRKYLGGIGINATRLVLAEEALRESEEQLRRQNALLQSINLVHKKAMECNSMEELGSACLEIAGALIRAPYGFVGEIREDGRLYSIAVNLAGWDACTMDDKASGSNHMRIGDPNMVGLFRRVFEDGKSILANDPPAHGASTGVPRGHFALSSFLGSPFLSGGKVLGLIGMANKPGGFTEKDRDALDALTPMVLEALLRKRVEAAHRESEARLRELSRNLAAEVGALRLFHRINTRFIRQEEIQSVYKDVLDAAIELTGADCGTLQLADGHGRSLELVVHKGVSEAFARHFERVSDDKAVSGKAMKDRTRVIVCDVASSPIFDGSDNRQILLSEGICCVQSTPMFSGSGKLMGMLATHYKTPYDFSDRDLRALDILARQAADVIDSVRMEKALQEREEQANHLAAELEKRNRLVTDFFINISHEFKTPLTILMLGLELLEAKAKRARDGEAFLGNLEAMKQNSYRLNRLVGNLLDITKLDAGFMQPKWEKADAASLLRSLFQSVEPYARQRQLTLEFSCEPAEIPFTTDGFMLERIVLNLLSNAIKHTPAGGLIRLACRADGDGVSISIKDTGEGIPEDKQATLFDRFMQVDTRMTRISGGTGIGLALTKSLVELMGGKISVKSKPGAGSTFTAKLPYVQHKAVIGIQDDEEMEKRVQMEFSGIIES